MQMQKPGRTSRQGRQRRGRRNPNQTTELVMQHETSLDRFLTAQNRGGMYRQALAELRAGRKTSHWIWYMFPQIVGLGRSETSVFYGITGLDEARGYLAHAVLGPRLHEAAQALLDCGETDAVAVLGHIDAIKVWSSMTLFLQAVPDDTVFRSVLEKFYGGDLDRKTLDILAGQANHHTM